MPRVTLLGVEMSSVVTIFFKYLQRIERETSRAAQSIEYERGARDVLNSIMGSQELEDIRREYDHAIYTMHQLNRSTSHWRLIEGVEDENIKYVLAGIQSVMGELAAMRDAHPNVGYTKLWVHNTEWFNKFRESIEEPIATIRDFEQVLSRETGKAVDLQLDGSKGWYFELPEAEATMFLLKWR